MKNFTLLLLVCLFLASCATSKRLNRISVGMSKQEAISILGEPVSISQSGPDIEYLNYEFFDARSAGNPWGNGYNTYYVLLNKGIVEEYGRPGDFGPPLSEVYDYQEISKGQSLNLTETELMEKELKILKGLLDEGILTKPEYNIKKKEILGRY